MLMTTQKRSNAAGAPAELSLDYVFDAPRELVFENWLKPGLLSEWFAPDGFDVTRCEVEARTGGKWRVEFRAASGESHSEYGELHEIRAPERLVFSLTQADAHGRVGPKTTVEVTFVAQGEKTLIHFLQTGFDSARVRDGNAAGWKECFGKLARALTADAAAERELRGLFEDWWRVSSAKDIEGAMAPIAARVVSYEHEAPLQYVGVGAVREVCQRGFDAAKGEFRWDIPDLQVMVRGDLAVTWGLNRMQSREPGSPPVEHWSRGTRVFRKIDGGWQMIHQHVSYPYDPETGAAKLDLKPE
jgi:uncharacterized protein YndB with AHSA1/START domain/ketosteroid isomerase-like protein